MELSFPAISHSAYPHRFSQALLHPIMLNVPVISVTTMGRVSFGLSAGSEGRASSKVLGSS